MDVLERLLIDLHASIETRDSYCDSVAIVASIESIVQGDVDGLELDVCAALLLQNQNANPPSLLDYIVQTARVKDKEVVKAKVGALKFLARFLKANPSAVEPFAITLAVTSIEVFRKEESGEVKAALLLPLKNLFRPKLPVTERADSDAAVDDRPFDSVQIRLESLYSALLEELRYSKKLTKGVCSEALKLLGIVVGVYPVDAATVQHVDAIVSYCQTTLRDNFKATCSDPHFPVIAGCFSCLDRIFYQYGDKCDNPPELWKYLLQAMQTVNSTDVSKFAAAGKATRLVKNHADQFMDVIGLNAFQSYTIVLAAYESGKTALVKHAYDALSAVMTQLANYLVSRCKGQSNGQLIDNSLKDPYDTVSRLLNENIAVVKEVQTAKADAIDRALKGIMNIALSLPTLFELSSHQSTFSPLDIMRIIISAAQQCELVSATSAPLDTRSSNDRSQDQWGSKLLQSSSNRSILFLGATVRILFALFLQGFDDKRKRDSFAAAILCPEVRQFCDEYLTASVIAYVSLWKKQQRQLESIVVMVWYMCTFSQPVYSPDIVLPLSDIRETLWGVLIMRTVSRKGGNESLNISSSRLSEYTGELDDRLFYGYIPLWQQVCSCSDLLIRTLVIPAFGPSILDQCSAAVIDWTIRGVLRTIEELDLTFVHAEELNASGMSWVPRNIVDHDIVINIVQFLSIFLRSTQVSANKHTMQMLFPLIVRETISLSASNPLVGSFYELLMHVTNHVSDELEVEIHKGESSDALQMLRSFCFSLQQKIQCNPIDFNGQLLDAALGLILSLPVGMVSIQQLSPTFEMSLRSGSNLLQSVRQLTRSIIHDYDSSIDVVSSLVPKLNVYVERLAKEATAVSKLNALPNKSESKDLQSAILELLGRVGGLNKLLLSNPASVVEESLSWSTEPLTTVSVVGIDPTMSQSNRMTVAFDTVLIQLTALLQQLLLSNDDNQLLLSSAETFHALVVVLIGNLNLAGKQNSEEFLLAFERCFSVVLKLASRPIKSQQVFEVLLFQTIHWLTSAGSTHTEISAVLVDVLLGAICNASVDNAEKEMAAKALEEYFSWSMRQFDNGNSSASAVIILMNKLITLLSHPLSACRRGGVGIAKRIYKHLRENAVLVGRYSMQLLMVLLNMTKVDSTSDHELENEIVIQKYEEIVALAIIKRGWINEFLNPTEDRVFPVDLNALVIWLWENAITAKEKPFRRLSMRCFVTFAPLLKSVSNEDVVRSCKEFMNQWMDVHHHSSIVAAINSISSSGGDLSSSHTLRDCQVLLDVLTWLLTVGLQNPMEIVAQNIECISSCFQSILSTSSESTISTKASNCFVYALLAFIHQLMRCCDPSLVSKLVNRLSEVGIWSETFMQLVTNSLSSLANESVVTESQDLPSYRELFGAVRHVFRYAAKLSPSAEDSILAVFRQYVEKHFNSAFCSNSDANQWKMVQSTLAMLRDCSMESSILGSYFEIFKQDIVARVLNRIQLLCLDQSSPSDLIFALFGVAIEAGIKWMPAISLGIASSSSIHLVRLSDEDSGSWSSLVDCFLSDIGSLLFSRIRFVLIPALLRKESSLSLWARSNMQLILQHHSQSIVFRSILEAVVLEISTRLSTQTSDSTCEFYANALLPGCLSLEHGLESLEDNIVSILLSIDSQVCANELYCESGKQLRDWVFQDCICKFKNARKSSMESLQARLSWLPYVLRGNLIKSPRNRFSLSSLSGGDDLKGRESCIAESLEDFVSSKFPLDSNELNPASEQGKQYLSLLESYLGALEQCGSVSLLLPLLPSFREGDKHRYYNRMRNAIQSVADGIIVSNVTEDSATEGPTKPKDLYEIQVLCNFCLDLVLDPFQDFVIKRTFFDALFLPILCKMTSKSVALVFSASSVFLNLQQTCAQPTALTKTMYDILSKDVPTIGVALDEFEIKGKLYLQIVCYRIFSFLFDYCSLVDLKGPITRSFVGSDSVSGKELTQALCKLAFKSIKPVVAANGTPYRDLSLELQTVAYECLSIIVAKTQSEEQFFDTFLFKVKVGDDLWERITTSNDVDTFLAGVLPVVTESFASKRLGWDRILQDSSCLEANSSTCDKLRNLSARARRRLGKGGLLSQYVNGTLLSASHLSLTQVGEDVITKNRAAAANENLVNYSQSQYYSEEGARLDEGSKGTRYDLVSENELSVSGWDDFVIYFELNHLNTIPIMPVMIRTITRMNKLFQSKWKALPTGQLPFWLQEFRSRLSDPSATPRVRLFFLRLLLNQPVTEIVSTWINELLPAILDCVVRDLCNGAINYFLRDVVFALCDTWRLSIPTVFCTSQIEKLINYFFSNIANEEPRILQENVACVDALIRQWLGTEDMSNVNLCMAPLLSMLTVKSDATGGAHAKSSSKGSVAVRSKLAAFEVLSVLLDRNYHWFLSSTPESAQLLSEVVSHTKYPRKEVSEIACTIAGKLLTKKKEYSTNREHLLPEKMKTLMEQVLQAVDTLRLQKFGSDLVASCLKAVTEQCPEFLTRELIMKTIHLFPQLQFRPRYQYLMALTSCSFRGNDFKFIDLIRPYFRSLLSEMSTVTFGRGVNSIKVPIVQVSTLTFLAAFVDELTPDTARQLLGDSDADGLRLCVNSSSACVQVRDAAYQFAMIASLKINQKIKDSQSLIIFSSQHDENMNVREVERWKALQGDYIKFLLRGLTDLDDSGLQLDWNDMHAVFHDFSHYENPVYWIHGSGRIGIRRRILEYFNFQWGLGSGLFARITSLMSTDLFDPVNIDEWLKYSAYLSLLQFYSSNSFASLPLFSCGLDGYDCTASQGRNLDLQSTAEFVETESLSGATPLFALERTTQFLNNLAVSSQNLSQNLKSSIFSQSNFQATQSFLKGRRTESKSAGGVVLGTQQFAWTQTQAATGTSSGPAPDPVKSVQWTSGNNAYGTWKWTQFQSSTPSTQVVSVAPLAVAEPSNDQVLMPPPKELPRYMVSQRNPSRLTKSLVDGSKNYNAFRGIQVLKKLGNEKQALQRRRVTFYRRYRAGELPDICIPLSDLLLPMSSLCLQQSSIAARVLSVIFVAVLKVCSSEAALTLAHQFMQVLHLSKGQSVNGTFVKLVLKQLEKLLESGIAREDIAHFLTHDSLAVDLACGSGSVYDGLSIVESLISKLSIRSPSNHTFGNMGTATAAESGSQVSKRRKATRTTSSIVSSIGSEDSEVIANDLFRNFEASSSVDSAVCSTQLLMNANETSNLWHQMLKMYDYLQEEDILTTLPLKALSNKQKAFQLKQALDAEQRGEYLEALEIYSSFLGQPSAAAGNSKKRSAELLNESEVNSMDQLLWFERGTTCLNKMANWGNLLDFVSTRATTLLGLDDQRRSPSSFIDALASPSADTSLHLNQCIIPQYLRGLIHNSAGNEHNSRLLNEFLDKMLNSDSGTQQLNSDKLDNRLTRWFKDVCGIEVALAFLIRGDLVRAKLYADLSDHQFLVDWNELHPCATQARKRLLLRLEQIIELKDVLSMATAKTDNATNLNHLMRLWDRSEPSLLDPLSQWSTLMLIRQLPFKVNPSPASSLHLAKFHVRSALACVEQGVLTTVKPLLQETNLLRREVYGKAFVLTLDEVRVVSQYNRKSILRKPIDSLEIPDMFTKAFGLLDTKLKLLNQYSSDSCSSMVQTKARIERLEVKLMQADWNAFSSSYLVTRANLSSSLSATNSETIRSDISRKKFAALSNYVECIDQLPINAQIMSLGLKQSALAAAAHYCDQLLTEVERETTVLTTQQCDSLRSCVLNSVAGGCDAALPGMEAALASYKADSLVASICAQFLVAGLKYGSLHCSERILRLVSIVNKHSFLLPFFTSSLEQIPPWVFLRYANQMLGYLDKPEGLIVIPILERVAQVYPQALLYAYRITAENFGKQGKELSTTLKRLLENKNADSFIESLMGLTHPELRWSDGMKELDARCKVYFGETPSGPEVNKLDLGKKIIEQFEELKKSTIEPCWDNVGAKIGKYNIKWAKQMRVEVHNILGGKNERLLSNKSFIEKLKALSSKSDPALATGKVDLQEFSTWLLEYSDINGSHMGLEIPGQYSRYLKSKPAPETHEFISGFDSRLLVMASIRKPKRVKIFGHLGNETFFLVKGGEDLRNDERVEQLFMLMNSVIDSRMQELLNPSTSRSSNDIGVEELSLMSKTAVREPSPSARSLSLNLFSHGFAARTYTVIPMSTKVGVLEWVKNTVPLKSIIASELARDEDFVHANGQCLETPNAVDLSRIAAYRERLQWVSGHGAADYHKMFKKASRDQAYKIFDSVTEKTPSDLLKRYFKRRALTVEAFHTLRMEFAKSLSISNVFGYILGLGDRHLDNLLIDSQSGSVVQIDFGICFGIGSSLLPVPELIPFRLTPVLRGAMYPLDAMALSAQYMAKALQFLREDATGKGSGLTGSSGTISNALEVYINDPVVDWLRGISASDKDELESLRRSAELNGQSQWEPTRRVLMAIRKLRGEDPILLLLEELRRNSAVSKMDSFKSLTKILQAVQSACKSSYRLNNIGCESASAESFGDYGLNSMETRSLSWGDTGMTGDTFLSDFSQDGGINAQGHGVSLQIGEQVDLLLQLATDPDILARQWVGLQTWL